MVRSLGFRQAEAGRVERLDGEGMANDALGRVWLAQIPVPRAIGIERDVRPEVALTKTGVPDEAGFGLVAQQLSQTLA